MSDRERPEVTDLYEVLGVVPEVDPGELTRAYRRRLRSLHPDTRAAAPDEVVGNASRHLDELLHAYNVLRDPVSRAGYDAERARAVEHERRGSAVADAGSGRGRAGATPVPVRHMSRAPDPWLLRVGPVRIHSPQQDHQPDR